MSEWMPIETAPRDRVTDVLLWFPFSEGLEKSGCHFIGVWGYPLDYNGDELNYGPCWVDVHDSTPLGQPTHWMPLPSPPKEPTP